MTPDNVLLVAGAPVDPARLARVLYGPVRTAETIVLAVAALDDPLNVIERALRTFAATRSCSRAPTPPPTSPARSRTASAAPSSPSCLPIEPDMPSRPPLAAAGD